MRREGWNVILRYDEDFLGVRVWLLKHNADGSEIVVNPIDLSLTTNLEPGVMLPPPTFTFQGSEATQFLQGITEGLVAAGFRPDELKVSDQVLEATKYHLEDMRRLVMEALLPPEVPPPRIERIER